MVTCQSSELDWEVTVELPADFLSLGRGSVRLTILPGRQLGVRSSIYLYSESPSAHSRYIVSALT